MTDAAVDEVLGFWFGKLDQKGRPLQDKSGLWWGKSTDTDRLIRQRFASLLRDIRGGGRTDWLATPQGWLASIIVLDQFSRNIYRDQPQAFAADGQALALTLEGIEAGMDKRLAPVQRVFFYLPLEHAESVPMQEKSVRLFEELLETAAEADRPMFQGSLDFAEQHRDIIARFGRYPHRNALLGRTNTPEEEAFLQQPGSRF